VCLTAEYWLSDSVLLLSWQADLVWRQWRGQDHPIQDWPCRWLYLPAQVDALPRPSGNLLTVFQTATSVVLLAFTLLLLGLPGTDRELNFNFDTQSVSEIYWKLPDVPSGSDAERSFQNAFVERLKHLPGIQAAALCSPCRLGASFNVPRDWYDSIAVTPEYFGVANTPILHGRNFYESGWQGSPPGGNRQPNNGAAGLAQRRPHLVSDWNIVDRTIAQWKSWSRG